MRREGAPRQNMDSHRPSKQDCSRLPFLAAEHWPLWAESMADQSIAEGTTLGENLAELLKMEWSPQKLHMIKDNKASLIVPFETQGKPNIADLDNNSVRAALI